MSVYRVTLDVYNSRSDFQSLRVTIDVNAYSPQAARDMIRTVYVSRDRQNVTLTGGVGYGGSHYPEYEYVSTRKVAESRGNRVTREYARV